MPVRAKTTMLEASNADQPQFLPLHFVGRAREHMHLEKLTNLGALPRATGFVFVAFPVKLRDGSAGWVRPTALVSSTHFPGQGLDIPRPVVVKKWVVAVEKLGMSGRLRLVGGGGGPVPPGLVLVVEAAGAQAAVQDADKAVGQHAESLVVGLALGP
ncbi:MAG: hypothetical protein ACRDY2_03090, partial [Acidimicrobiales bacterium]